MNQPLAVVVIYHDPSDYPGRYVVRRQWASGGGVSVEADPLAVVNTLGEARWAVPPEMVRIPRDPNDEPQIVECWV